MDSLKREFLPRFFDLARTRVDKAREIARSPTSPTAEELARELHALAGEAGLLGLETVLGAARKSELAAADAVRRPDDTSTRDHLNRALTELEDALRTSARSAPAPVPAPASPVWSTRDKFRAQFVETASTRRQRILEAVDTETAFSVAHAEFHTLAGEASLLSMTAIAALCRDGGEAARRHDRKALATVLAQLEIAISAEQLTPHRPP